MTRSTMAMLALVWVAGCMEQSEVTGQQFGPGPNPGVIIGRCGGVIFVQYADERGYGVINSRGSELPSPNGAPICIDESEGKFGIPQGPSSS